MQKNIILAALFGLTSQTIFAQAGQAEISGIVNDSDAAEIPAARVIPTEISTGQISEINTDAGGTFIFTNKKPGIYSIKFAATDFTTLIREKVTLTTGERFRLDAVLAVATGQSTVTINVDAPLLRSETGSLGQIIDNKTI